jgi:hypothetical protein
MMKVQEMHNPSCLPPILVMLNSTCLKKSHEGYINLLLTFGPTDHNRLKCEHLHFCYLNSCVNI